MAKRLPFFQELGGSEFHSEQAPCDLSAWDDLEAAPTVTPVVAYEEPPPPLPRLPRPRPALTWLDEVLNATDSSIAHATDNADTGNFRADVLQKDRRNEIWDKSLQSVLKAPPGFSVQRTGASGIPRSMSAITNERPHPDATTTATTLTTMTTTTKAAAVVAAATTTATISHNQLTVEEEWTQPLPPVAFCPRTPERVLTRTLDGELQMLRCSYLAPGEEAMISPQWSLSPLPERSCWDAPYRLRLPGATPLQGAIDLTTEEVDDLLNHAFEVENKDKECIERAYDPRSRIVTSNQQDLLISTIVWLGQEALADLGDDYNDPLSVDTVALAIYILLRFEGTVGNHDDDDDNDNNNNNNGVLLTTTERELLPMVCLDAAYKLEHVRYSSIADPMLRSLETPEDSFRPIKKQMAALEWRVLDALRHRLTSPTPITFLHHLFARALSEGALTHAQAPSIGEKAVNIVWRLVEQGFCAEYVPSEIAAAAVVCGTLRAQGIRTTLNVAAAVGCPPSHCSSRVLELALEAGFSLREYGFIEFDGMDVDCRGVKGMRDRVTAVGLPVDSDTDELSPASSPELTFGGGGGSHEDRGGVGDKKSVGFPCSQVVSTNACQPFSNSVIIGRGDGCDFFTPVAASPLLLPALHDHEENGIGMGETTPDGSTITTTFCRATASPSVLFCDSVNRENNGGGCPRMSPTSRHDSLLPASDEPAINHASPSIAHTMNSSSAGIADVGMVNLAASVVQSSRLSSSSLDGARAVTGTNTRPGCCCYYEYYERNTENDYQGCDVNDRDHDSGEGVFNGEKSATVSISLPPPFPSSSSSPSSPKNKNAIIQPVPMATRTAAKSPKAAVTEAAPAEKARDTREQPTGEKEEHDDDDDHDHDPHLVASTLPTLLLLTHPTPSTRSPPPAPLPATLATTTSDPSPPPLYRGGGGGNGSGTTSSTFATRNEEKRAIDVLFKRMGQRGEHFDDAFEAMEELFMIIMPTIQSSVAPTTALRGESVESTYSVPDLDPDIHMVDEPETWRVFDDQPRHHAATVGGRSGSSSGGGGTSMYSGEATGGLQLWTAEEACFSVPVMV